jgi:sialic acid synthase
MSQKNKPHTYLIGEIGQNHNGSIDIARLIIDLAARPAIDELFHYKLMGMDAVKLTKRDLNFELSNSALKKPYNTPHSFGRTYGEHRKALEFNDEEHYELYKYAKEKGLDFVETLCAPSCLSLLKYFSPDRLKVASRDLTNLPLLQALAETKLPLILSTGMAGQKELNEALDVITNYHDNISILHCVSEYPTIPQNVNLNSIPFLKENYPEFVIGYSDHTIGIATPLAAAAMGAGIIEKHITIDRMMKGTDQSGSLGIEGVQRMVRDIRLLELSLGEKAIFSDPAVEKAKVKLERSIAVKKSMKEGDILQEDDFQMLSPGDGYKWNEKDLLIGKVLKKDIDENEIIYPEFHF